MTPPLHGGGPEFESPRAHYRFYIFYLLNIELITGISIPITIVPLPDPGLVKFFLMLNQEPF